MLKSVQALRRCTFLPLQSHEKKFSQNSRLLREILTNICLSPSHFLRGVSKSKLYQHIASAHVLVTSRFLRLQLWLKLGICTAKSPWQMMFNSGAISQFSWHYLPWDQHAHHLPKKLVASAVVRPSIIESSFIVIL